MFFLFINFQLSVLIFTSVFIQICSVFIQISSIFLNIFLPFFQNNTTRPICKFLNSVGFFTKVALMYIFEKLSTHYKILLLVETYFFVITSWCVLYSYIFSREILSRHRPIKLHHAYPFYLNFYFSRNFLQSGICLYN